MKKTFLPCSTSDLVNRILLTLYLAAVTMGYIFIAASDNLEYLLIFNIPVLVLSYMVVSVLFRRIRSISLKPADRTKGRPLAVFCIAAAACLLIMMLWYAAFYPGSFSPDTIGQYGQALTGRYKDWHPVWQTLVFYTLPLKLTGKASSIVLFQIIWLSLSIGYMTMVIWKNAGVRAAVISFAVILLNPNTNYIVLYPWKDVGFGMTAMVSCAMAAEIFFDTSGRWSSRKWRLILLGFIIASCTIFRHNAILFTAPLLLALFFQMDRKKWLCVLLTFLAAVILIKGPLYSALHVEKPGNRVVETVGLPLTIIGNVVKETPGVLDDEMKSYVYAIAPQDLWDSTYECGNFNSIKWHGADTSIVEEKGAAYAVRIMLKCMAKSPKAAFKGLISLTDMVYGVDEGIVSIGSEFTKNDYGLTQQGNTWLRDLLNAYASAFGQSFLKYLQSMGLMLILMLLFILAGLGWKSKESRRKLLLCLPVFVYDFGTMLLLTGNDARFFYETFLVCPLVIMISLGSRGRECGYDVREKKLDSGS